MRYLIFALLLGIALVLVDGINSWAFGWLFYLMAVHILLALRVTDKRVKLVESRRRLSQQAASIGEPVIVQVTAQWQGARGPGWVLVQDILPPSMQRHLPSGRLTLIGLEQTTAFTYRISGEQRGYFPIGPLQLTVGDLFGLMQTTLRAQEYVYLTVYPRIVPIPRLLIPSNRPIGDARSSKRIYEDSTRTVGVRDYQPGDPQSRIHWKTTARLGTLATKLCEPSTSIEVNIVLNLAAGDHAAQGETLELACTTAASVAHRLLTDKHHVGLQSNGYDAAWQHDPKKPHEPLRIPPEKGQVQTTAILSALGRLQLSGSPSLGEYLVRMHSHLPWTASTLIITPCLSDAAVTGIEGLLRTGFELAVIVVGTGAVADDARRRAAALGLLVAIVRTERDLGQLEFWHPGRD
jgi:uncharacterized protein (DUF58 family)